MSSDAARYTFRRVPISQAQEAFEFHKELAHTDPHLVARSFEKIREYADDGCLYGARDAEGRLCGLCYAALEDGRWEIGGLTVPVRLQGCGIGSTLICFTAVRTLLVETERVNADEPRTFQNL